MSQRPLSLVKIFPDHRNGNLVPESEKRPLIRSDPTDLDQAIAILKSTPHPDIPVNRTISKEAVAQAIAWLQTHATDLAPADHGRLTMWLLPINKGLASRKLPEIDFKQLVEALEIGAGNLPGMVFSAATQRLGLTTWSWPPTVQEIVHLVTDAYAPHLEHIRLVRQIAGME